MAKIENEMQKVEERQELPNKKITNGRKLLETFIGFILALFIVAFIDYGLSHGASASNVHIYGID
ncbi:hypothetical protein [Acidiplasma aeolicum]|uniref:hypothetical protein n=1 Tax=Acidiplasma aeolicum TaxID=507754 RepID=UPI00371061C4